MQVKIAKILNNMLIVITLFIVALGVGIIFVAKDYNDILPYYIASFVLISIALAVVFKWLEARWDKWVITKMVKNGKAALFNIKSAERVLPLRDSSFINYWIYKFEGTLYDRDNHEAIKATFYEKMNRETDKIPAGTVYVTYDETKPTQIFIIPNLMISHMPNLIPIVSDYEADKKISLKYLDVFYNRGMVLKTFRETVADHAAQRKKGQ